MRDRQHRRLRHAVIAGVWFLVAVVNVALAAGISAYPFWAALVFSMGAIFIGLRALDARGAVPVIVYHSVSDCPDWLPWAKNTSVRPKVFSEHLEVLRRGDWNVISSWDLYNARREGKTLPRRSLVIHFDDGYLDNHVAAVPLLRQSRVPATFFVSTDFIDPSTIARPQLGSDVEPKWDGYMNAVELRELDADPLFDIASHGTDHGRVPIGPGPVDELTPENWKSHAPWFWADTPGDKAHWYLNQSPMRPFGTPVPETDSSLCASAWDPDEGLEPDEDRRQRVLKSLRTSRETLSAILAREVRFLCWPFDRVTSETLELARSAGFTLFTGGRGENRAGEAPDILSRVHINDHSAGDGLPDWVEPLVFRARIGVAAGELWFLPITWAAARRRNRTYKFEHASAAAMTRREIS